MPSSVPTTTQILTPSAFSSPSSLSSAPYSIFSLLLSLLFWCQKKSNYNRELEETEKEKKKKKTPQHIELMKMSYEI